jgi:hypothetical protein
MIAAAYLGIAYFSDGGETAFRVGMFLILFRACILMNPRPARMDDCLHVIALA